MYIPDFSYSWPGSQTRMETTFFVLIDLKCDPLELKALLIEADKTCCFFFTAEQNAETVDSMEVLSPEEAATTIKFTYHSNAQMISVLKKTEERCSDIARTYSIGRSMEGRELLVIEFSNNPGEHELRK